VQKQDKGWDEGITGLCRMQEVAPGCCCTRRPGGVPAEGTGVRVRVKGTRGLGSHPQSPPSRTEMRVAGGTNTGSLLHPS